MIAPLKYVFLCEVTSTQIIVCIIYSMAHTPTTDSLCGHLIKIVTRARS